MLTTVRPVDRRRVVELDESGVSRGGHRRYVGCAGWNDTLRGRADPGWVRAPGQRVRRGKPRPPGLTGPRTSRVVARARAMSPRPGSNAARCWPRPCCSASCVRPSGGAGSTAAGPTTEPAGQRRPGQRPATTPGTTPGTSPAGTSPAATGATRTAVTLRHRPRRPAGCRCRRSSRGRTRRSASRPAADRRPARATMERMSGSPYADLSRPPLREPGLRARVAAGRRTLDRSAGGRRDRVHQRRRGRCRPGRCRRGAGARGRGPDWRGGVGWTGAGRRRRAHRSRSACCCDRRVPAVRLGWLPLLAGVALAEAVGRIAMRRRRPQVAQRPAGAAAAGRRGRVRQVRRGAGRGGRERGGARHRPQREPAGRRAAATGGHRRPGHLVGPRRGGLHRPGPAAAGRCCGRWPTGTADGVRPDGDPVRAGWARRTGSTA